jgi:hypothetical protein
MTPSGSAAAMVRLNSEDDPPTFLLDELDTVYVEKTSDSGAQDIQRFLNSGYERGAVFVRCAKHGGEIEVERFPAFCPKMLAAIDQCLPETVLDRSLPIEIQRQTKDKHAQRLRKRSAAAGVASLRDELKVLSAQKELIEKLRDARPEMPDELNDRQQDICEPLLAIADEAGGDWLKMARDALIFLYGKADKERDLHTRLLADIKRIFDSTGEDSLFTQDLLSKLIDISTDTPWAEWFEELLKREKVQSAGTKLARRLKRYGIKPGTIDKKDEFGASISAKGYKREQFEETWKRYLDENFSSVRVSSEPSSRRNFSDSTEKTDSPTTSTAPIGEEKTLKNPKSKPRRLSPQKNPKPDEDDEDPSEVAI